MSVLPLTGGVKRALAGMPFIISVAHGPGRVAFSRDATGELVVLPLHPGMELDVREHAFLLASHTIDYTFLRIKGLRNILFGGQGMFMDRFVTTSTPGLLLLHGYGNVFERTLKPGESILVEPGAFLYKDSAVKMDVEPIKLTSGFFGGTSMNLARGDRVYFSHHVLLWMDTQVKVTAMSLKGAWKRMLAGMPLIMTQAEGPGRIAFSRDAPGEMIALPLQPSQAIDVREHLFMVATGSVTYDWFQSNVWFSTREGNETETHSPLGMLIDSFHSQSVPGLLLLHAAGNVFVRTLQPGQTILIKQTAFLFKDTTVNMQLHIERPAGTWRSWRSWGDRYLWLRLHGPGRVAIQSAFEPLEDNGRTIVSHSGATQRQW